MAASPSLQKMAPSCRVCHTPYVLHPTSATPPCMIYLSYAKKSRIKKLSVAVGNIQKLEKILNLKKESLEKKRIKR